MRNRNDTSKFFALLLASLFALHQAVAQGTFQNLDFESANLTAIPQGQVGSLVPISAGLPSWTGFLGSSQTTQVFQNNVSTGSASIDVFGPDFGGGPGGIIEGNYTAVLQAGESSTGFVAATIQQSGTVPGGSASIQMKFGTGATGFDVSVGGQEITMVPLGNGANYTLYGGNLPASLTGNLEELSISALPTTANSFNGFTLDSIVFSSNPVPEPGTWTLLLFGAGLLGVARRAQRKFRV